MSTENMLCSLALSLLGSPVKLHTKKRVVSTSAHCKHTIGPLLPRVSAFLAESESHQIRGAVEHEVVLVKVGRGVYKADQLHHARYPVEIAIASRPHLRHMNEGCPIKIKTACTRQHANRATALLRTISNRSELL